MTKKKRRPCLPSVPDWPGNVVGAGCDNSNIGLTEETTDRLLAVAGPQLAAQPDWEKLKRLAGDLGNALDILTRMAWRDGSGSRMAPVGDGVQQAVKMAAEVIGRAQQEIAQFLLQAGVIDSGLALGSACHNADGLIVKAGGLPIFIENRYILEIAKKSDRDVINFRGRSFIHHRGKMTETFRLAEILAASCQGSPDEATTLTVLFVLLENTPVALIVDEVIGRERVMYTVLPEYLRSAPGITGAAVSSKGEVLLIIDVDGCFVNT
ncbi:chemotaxis protein CheW [Sporolituus thermophilus]|nr:chemotaxis protein CheW [Sporolituus thermophilus]